MKCGLRRIGRGVRGLAPVVAIGVGALFAARAASADDAEAAAKAERCGTRLSIAILGTSPDAALRASSDPQSSVDAMLATPAFREHFARFVNATYNRQPGSNAAEDAPYWLTRHVLERNLPWKELFVGPYRVEADANGAVVTDDAEGLGYFRSPAWLARYAGNTADGLKIVTAYRIAHNTVGLKLTAVTNAEEADVSATGRAKQPCASCHTENWYALDKLATVLTRAARSPEGELRFDPPVGGAQTVLGDVTVSNDKELVTALVDSEAFRFRQCRLAFNYLYGRDENRCEGAIFDKCMDAFTAAGTIQSAIAAVAKDASFCEGP